MKQVPKNNTKLTDFFYRKGINHRPNNAQGAGKTAPPLSRILHPSSNLQLLKNGNSTKSKYVDRLNDNNTKDAGNKDLIEIDIQNESNCTQPIVQINNQSATCCRQFVFVGPCDVVGFDSVYNRLLSLKDNYTKTKVISFILQNIKLHKGTNLKNLQKIDDSHFWSHTVPKMLQIVLQLKYQQSICSSLPVFTRKNPQLQQVSKLQILILIINMFFGLIPDQMFRNYLSFAYIMGHKEKDSEDQRNLRLEKLKCVVNYLKIMVDRDFSRLAVEYITLQRVVNECYREQILSRTEKMTNVKIKFGKIQQEYRQNIMVDFANKSIGGGALTNGAAQQQIMFCAFPQLFATICLFQQMQDNQAIIITNAQKFNIYEGYSTNFKFKGSHLQKALQNPQKSIIIAIDAIDYNEKLVKGDSQYTIAAINRQTLKAYVGFEACNLHAGNQMAICTGRWGCGAFRGDLYLKFIIQWIACSLANKDMLYMAQDEKQMQQLKTMTKFMKNFSSFQLLETIRQYHGFNRGNKKINFLQFIKKQIS